MAMKRGPCLAITIALAAAACTPTLDTVSLDRDMTGSLQSAGMGTTILVAELPAAAGSIRADYPAAGNDGLRWEAQVPGGKPGERGRIVLSRRLDDGAPLEPGRPSREGIVAELAAAFPDRAMRVVDTPLYNAYGPIGAAVGGSLDGVTCVYGWQWIAGQPRLPQPPGGAVSWRIELCRRDALPATLVDWLKQVSLKPAGAARAASPSTPAVRVARKTAPARSVAASAPVATSPTGLYLAPLTGSASQAAPGAGPAPWSGATTPVPLPPTE